MTSIIFGCVSIITIVAVSLPSINLIRLLGLNSLLDSLLNRRSIYLPVDLFNFDLVSREGGFFLSGSCFHGRFVFDRGFFRPWIILTAD